MATVQYDPSVIRKFAARLYARARSVMITYTFVGGVIGAMPAVWFTSTYFGSWEAGLLVGAVLGGAMGYALGVEKAFRLKLQAQTALCQVQIEANTRARAMTARDAQ